ncbi:MAG: nucleotidyl transferase AbiEii/AbiGii toxin family protein, partial [Brevundimonas sp.]|uniref:nucleotidyl transferase AbiEii/AbiGii toxin family protein n=1 Tax=Brevundimonas sp. TaxID=1871086 RepID=UPI002ABAAB64
MPFGDLYERQVRLLIRALPFVLAETEFALKGGTAINLFVRDLPRLSVDIDLTYLPVRDRAESLAAIDAGLRRIADAMAAMLPGVVVTPGQRGPKAHPQQHCALLGVEAAVRLGDRANGLDQEARRARLTAKLRDRALGRRLAVGQVSVEPHVQGLET